MTRLPDLEAWAVFAKVAETGSFARAARELGMANPTVSKALARLEARLGAALFQRSSRRLSLTETGRASLERATAILADGEALETDAAAQAVAPRGVVRVAAPMSFGIQHLGPALPEFLALYPEISLDLNLSDQRVDLIGGGFDLALRIGTLEDSALRARRLCAVRILLVGAPGYFERHGRPQHPRDLAGHVGLGYANGGPRESWRFEHADHGAITVAVPCPVRANNADVLTPLLHAGAGLALQPEFLVWRDLQEGILERCLPDWSQAAISLHLLTPANTLRPARVVVLMEFLIRHFAQSPWAQPSVTSV